MPLGDPVMGTLIDVLCAVLRCSVLTEFGTEPLEEDGKTLFFEDHAVRFITPVGVCEVLAIHWFDNCMRDNYNTLSPDASALLFT